MLLFLTSKSLGNRIFWLVQLKLKQTVIYHGFISSTKKSMFAQFLKYIGYIPQNGEDFMIYISEFCIKGLGYKVLRVT